MGCCPEGGHVRRGHGTQGGEIPLRDGTWAGGVRRRGWDLRGGAVETALAGGYTVRASF